jgi:hypothetical protein
MKYSELKKKLKFALPRHKGEIKTGTAGSILKAAGLLDEQEKK